ncbi:hypothetical protein [Ralstonia phage RPZH3]|nr:hypothetical protein [Ralstonia phage RPZH3]
MTTAQNQALGRAEAHASKEHTIVIMVDNERAARVYRQALTKIGLMIDDLEMGDYFEPFETLLKDWWAERGGGA